MPSALSKRKSRPAEEDKKDSGQEDAAAILRRHFESRFKLPAGIVPVTKKAQESEDDDDDEDEEDSDFDSDSDDGWNGLSGEEGEDDEVETPKVQIIDHTKSEADVTATMSKKELKAYLSSKPPTSTDPTPVAKKAKTSKEEGDEDSAAFLANDLALQRLIAESHILSAAGGNASHYLSSAAATTTTNTRAFAEGRIRKKTTDLRIQALGAKTSVLSQEKMPMSMRKGIKKSTLEKEDKRRREAKENGIILERQAQNKTAGGRVQKKRKDRPVDLPGVGRMRGAELRISARDVRDIQGSGSSSGGRGGRGGGGKRRR